MSVCSDVGMVMQNQAVPMNDYCLQWTNNGDGTLTVKVQAATTGYVAIGVSPGTMPGTHAVISSVDAGSLTMGMWELTARAVPTVPAPQIGATQEFFEESNGVTTVIFTASVAGWGVNMAGVTTLAASFSGSGNDALSYHGFSSRVITTADMRAPPTTEQTDAMTVAATESETDSGTIRASPASTPATTPASTPATTPASTAAPPSNIRYTGRQLRSSGQQPSAAACEASCNGSNLCAAWTWWESSTWCGMFSDSSRYAPAKDTTVSGTSLAACDGLSFNTRFVLTDPLNTMMSTQRGVLSEEECCTVALNAGGVAFQYKAPKEKCVVLSAADGATTNTQRFGVMGRVNL